MIGLARHVFAQPAFWRTLDARIARGLRARASAVRGVLQALTTSTHAPLAILAGRADEVATDVEVAELFGFTSSPPAQTEVIAVPIGGSSAHLVIIGQIDRASRPTDLVPGETRIYCSQAGTQISIRPDGTLHLDTTSGASLLLNASGHAILNGGAAGVARQGDSVTLSAALVVWLTGVGVAAGAGAFPGPWEGSISSASTTVKAG